jgi:hypothetical protein
MVGRAVLDWASRQTTRWTVKDVEVALNQSYCTRMVRKVVNAVAETAQMCRRMGAPGGDGYGGGGGGGACPGAVISQSAAQWHSLSLLAVAELDIYILLLALLVAPSSFIQTSTGVSVVKLNCIKLASIPGAA